MRYFIVILLFFMASCSNEKQKDVISEKPDTDSLNNLESLSLIKKYNAIKEWPYNFTIAMRDNLIDTLVGVIGFVRDIDRLKGETVIKVTSTKPSYIANIFLPEDKIRALITDIPKDQRRYKGCFIFRVIGIDNNLSIEENKRIFYGSLVDYYIYKKDE